MHTYLKRPDGYAVGSWLRSREGYDSFSTLFTVDTMIAAIVMVNILNGGDYRVATNEMIEGIREDE